MSQLNLSARGYYRVLKLARTIADLAGSETIKSVYLAAKLINEPFIEYVRWLTGIKPSSRLHLWVSRSSNNTFNIR